MMRKYQVQVPRRRGGSNSALLFDISPILANMALDGMEDLIMKRYPKMKVHFVRYADDFVVTTPTREIAEEVKSLISDFLAKRGLTLSESKTKITHINDGFDFLGINIRKYRGVLLMKPSKESVKKITRKIGLVLLKAAAWNQDKVIQKLNPIIIGWTNYHRHIASTKTFNRMDFILWNQLWQWAKRRHPDKGRKWVAQRYWSKKGNRNWVFCSEEQTLKMFSETSIRRHFMVKLDRNPFLDREYFLNRIERMKKRTPDVQVKLTYFPIYRPKFGL
ncbi:group II intron maturase-specific domain-containing protein [Methanospirillum sp.]